MVPRNVILFFLIISVLGIQNSALQSQLQRHVPLPKVLNFLSKKHKVYFTYNPQVIKNLEVKISAFENLTIDEAIGLLKKITPYKIDALGNNYYVLYKVNNHYNKSLTKIWKDTGAIPENTHISKVNQLLRHKRRIKGVVLDQFNAPIDKANIVEKSTNNGTISRSDGTFELTVSGQKPIEISHIGYDTQLIYPIRNFVKIRLKSGVALDEVFVVGSRNNNRKKIDAPVSTDVIDIHQVKSESEFIKLNQFIQNVIPSFKN